MSRETVSYDMWWLQAGPSSPATYVMGGRVGMDETQQVKMHFNWDNLSSSSSSIPIPYIYILLLPPSGGTFDPYLLLEVSLPLKICIPFVAVLKKSKKRQAKTLLLQNRSTPIALAARSAGIFSSSIFQFSIKNLSFRSRLSQKSRKNVKWKHCFQKMHLAAGCP